ncbi:cyclic nucleotide-binding domain-containing protein [Ferrigenium sp. UT5]|uniref:cyclic nucleotide-binding domain-containing protein n=1 Tax=Ferrigenium sp. UT5 TaxID=3242105 RepID=UPI00354BC6D8
MNDMLDIRVLAALEPISSFSPARLRELLDYCQIENVAPGQDPFQNRNLQGQSVYLVRGELELIFADGNTVTMRADSEWARHPIGKRQPDIVAANALSPVQLMRVDDDLLDRMVTWDQFATHDDIKPKIDQGGSEAAVRRLLNSGMFSAENLNHGPFAHLPPANIGKLLNRVEAIAVWEKDVIVREGEEGDYYYLIESGRAQVTRRVGGADLLLAELKAGDVFGEEALISDSKRNATVTMRSNGVLLRMKKQDFLELMKEPLLHRISFAEAKEKVKQGAVWLDVRHPPEYRYDKLPGAINVPLNDIRNAVGVLNRAVVYVAYCQSGRRSSAAAFILAQAGYEVYVLENGLWSVPRAQQQ